MASIGFIAEKTYDRTMFFIGACRKKSSHFKGSLQYAVTSWTSFKALVTQYCQLTEQWLEDSELLVH